MIKDLTAAREVISKKDPSLCKNLSDPKMVDYCYEGIAISLNNAKICELIHDKTSEQGLSNYNQCYSEIAKNLKDDSYCVCVKGGGIVDDQDQCYSTVAIFKNDVSVCTKIKNVMTEDVCVSGLARTKKDPTLCDILPDITPQQECYQATGGKGAGCPGANSTDSVRKICKDVIAWAVNTQTDLDIILPNGGESWNVGETHNITWTSTGPSKKASIQLEDMSIGKMYSIADNLDNTAGNHSYSWTIVNIPKGDYRVKITELQPVGFKTWTMSNTNFTISAP